MQFKDLSSGQKFLWYGHKCTKLNDTVSALCKKMSLPQLYNAVDEDDIGNLIYVYPSDSVSIIAEDDKSKLPTYPYPGSYWQHGDGEIYEVLHIADRVSYSSADKEEWVVFKHCNRYDILTMPVSQWKVEMTYAYD